MGRRLGRMRSYWGHPAGADPAFGNQELKASLGHVFPKMRAVWEGASPSSLFRSWYSILPPNKSFFKAWLLLVLICLFIAAWGFLSVFMLQMT